MNATHKLPFYLLLILGGLLAFTGCATTAESPPPTISAVVANSDLLSSVDPSGMTILQDRLYGSGKIVLYQWNDTQGNLCIGTSYLQEIDGHLEMSDTATIPCQSDDSLMAAYTGNSQIETQLGFGDPRQTVVYGVSPAGHAVQIVWMDGQVERIPLNNSSFLTVRDGRLDVDRIELFDQSNQLIQVEEFQNAEVQLSS